MLDLAVVAIGLDDADILVDRATGGPDFDGSQVHVVKYHDKYRRNQGQIPMIPANLRLMLSLRFSGKNAGVAQKTSENKPDPRTGQAREGVRHPKHRLAPLRFHRQIA